MMVMTVDDDDALLDRIRELRERGRSPKEIARATGRRPAEIAPLIRQVAESLPPKEPRLIGCWINDPWAAGLKVAGHDDWPGLDGAEDQSSGLAVVVAAWDNGGNAICCNFLVDLWCLGVKNADGPQSLPRRKLPERLNMYYSSFARPPAAAPLDLARQVVFGAVDYARRLGFEPHADYARAAVPLGPWDGVCDIEFGRNGKPFYMSGPYDDQRRIMRKLRRAVGDGGFDYMAML